MDAGAGHLFLQDKLFAKQRRGIVVKHRLFVERFAAGPHDPGGSPIRRLEQAYFPPRGLPAVKRFPFPIPRADIPINAFSRMQ